VAPLVVDLLNPGGEQGVQLGQAAHCGAGPLGAPVGAVGDLDQELVPDSFEEPLNFSPTGWSPGLGMGELDAQHRARPAQPGVDEHRPVVHIGLGWAPTAGQADAQRLGQRHRGLGVPPAGRHHRPGVIVQEGNEDRLAPGHDRAVQRVTDPAGVGRFGLEPAEHRRWRPVGAPPVEPERAKWRCRVRGDGAHPACAPSTTATCAAVRPGASVLSATANSSTSGGVCGASRRGTGTRAVNPPAR